MGTDSTGYKQNMIFTKNAFALVSVPLVSPPGAVDVSRQSYKGCNVRVIPVYDGTNDVSKWRLDILYGVKTLDERQALTTPITKPAISIIGTTTATTALNETAIARINAALRALGLVSTDG
jgi:hypothetical protein